MRLIAVAGMRHQPNARFTQALVDALSAETDRLARPPVSALAGTGAPL